MRWVVGSLLGMYCWILGAQDTHERIALLEKEMQQIMACTAANTHGALFASGHRNQQWGIELDPLLWHVKSGGVDWLIALDQGTLPCSGQMDTLPFGWSWGVRAGVHRYFDHDAWDVDLCYTYYRTADSSKQSVDFSDPSSAQGTSSASFSGKITYNAIDLLLGKELFISKYLKVHPRLGLKNIWLNQRYRLIDNNVINATATTLAVAGTVDLNLLDRNKLWGIGPEVGLDVDWYLSRCFKILGQVNGSLLQGYFKVSQYEQIAVTPTGSTSTQSQESLQGNMHRFVPYVRSFLGLGWEDDFNDRKQRVQISLGYEINYFWRVNQTINQIGSLPTDPSLSSTESVRLFLNRESEDLGFYGVTLRVNVDF